MNEYINGELIKRLREKNGMTQSDLAGKIGVSDKTISKWETGRGLPDITLTAPLAQALGLSLGELFAGEQVINGNRSSNMKRSCLYVCPICGNIIQSTGAVSVSCCGISLPSLESEKSEAADEVHRINIQMVEDEFFVTTDHPMTKDHHLDFIQYRTMDRVETVKLYPEGSPQCRFFKRGHGEILIHCNHHGLFSARV